MSTQQRRLEMLEALLHSLGYKVRYEKGNFKSGACILQANNVIMVHKSFTLAQRINVLIKIMQVLPANEDLLDDKQKKLFIELKQEKRRLKI